MTGISVFLFFILILAIGFFGAVYLILPRFKGSEVIPSFVNYGNAKLVTAGGFALLAVMSFINFLAILMNMPYYLIWILNLFFYMCEAVVMVGFIAMYFTRDNIFDLGAAAGIGINFAVCFANLLFRIPVSGVITIICSILLYASLAAKKLKGGNYILLGLIGGAFLLDVIIMPLIASAVSKAYMGITPTGFFTYHLVNSRWLYPFIALLANIISFGACALACLDSSDEE